VKDPTVSIIIPCRNEARFIAKCLDSILAQDYPHDLIEIFVVDGMSDDGTKVLVERYAKKHPIVMLLDNPKRIIPAAMNIGIKRSRGDVIMKFDAHAIYKNNYISECVRYLCEYGADNVGGVVETLPRNNSILGAGIAASLSCRFGVGGGGFRVGAKEPMWSDTAFSGCYRREVFDRVGLYDENVARSEDVALNRMLRKSGGKILLVPDIRTSYFTRSTIGEFCRHNFDNGYWITYPLKYGRIVFSGRHLAPLCALCVFMALVIISMFSISGTWLLLAATLSYLVTCMYYSVKLSAAKRRLAFILVMPMIFATLHFGYALGSLFGLIKALGSCNSRI
jgi:glycosyltransferase involved in cell wall biosynthesis